MGLMGFVVINSEIVQGACDFISRDLNIYLTHDQMFYLLSSNAELVERIHDFWTEPDAVKQAIHEHFCQSLTGQASPFQSDEDISTMPDADIEAFMLKLQNAAAEKGYRYSTHPDGPDADELLD